MIIDTDVYSESGITIKWFPGGEMHVELPRTLPPGNHVHIHAKLRTWKAVGEFMAVCNALRHRNRAIHVFMPYFPGARQDRVQLGDLTVEMYARMFADVTDSITVTDIHSPEALKEIKKAGVAIHTLPLATFIPELITEKFDVVLAADKGGVERARQIAQLVDCKRIEFCLKDRNPENGHITTSVPNLEINDMNHVTKILVPDDICDGGWTFTNIFEQMVKVNRFARLEFYLYVTHGIFSKGLEPLFKVTEENKVHPSFPTGFVKVYTTDSFWNGNSPSVVSAPLLSHYLETLTP